MLFLGHKKEYKTLASGFESIAESFATDNAPCKCCDVLLYSLLLFAL